MRAASHDGSGRGRLRSSPVRDRPSLWDLVVLISGFPARKRWAKLSRPYGAGSQPPPVTWDYMRSLVGSCSLVLFATALVAVPVASQTKTSQASSRSSRKTSVQSLSPEAGTLSDSLYHNLFFGFSQITGNCLFKGVATHNRAVHFFFRQPSQVRGNVLAAHWQDVMTRRESIPRQAFPPIKQKGRHSAISSMVKRERFNT